MRIGIVGLGLIGGSMAMALQSRTQHAVLGYDNDQAALSVALDKGAICAHHHHDHEE